MAEAETAQNAKNYSYARYSLQQALMGVKIQLGRKVLKSLPAAILPYRQIPCRIKYPALRWGRAILVYNGFIKTEQINNLPLPLEMPVYMPASVEKQNFKQVKVKGNKAIIQYDDRKGYTLIASIGQTSNIVWECINFASEQEVMTAANSFDIDGIKKILGEQ